MAQIVVRNLDESVKLRLKKRAALHGRSMEEEVRQILNNAAKAPATPKAGLGTRIAARFAGLGWTGELPDLRGQQPRVPKF